MMRLYRISAAKRITALLLAAVLLTLLPPSRYACAAGDYTAVDEEPLYWTENYTAYTLNSSQGKQAKTHFAAKLVSDSAFTIGFATEDDGEYFAPMEITGRFFPVQKIGFKEVTSPEDFKPYIIRNVEPFTVDHIPFQDVESNRGIKDYYASFQGVLFDLYTYDGQRIGFSADAKTGDAVANELRLNSFGLNETQRDWYIDAITMTMIASEIRLDQAGPSLSMPAGYSFALFDLCVDYNTSMIMPVAGEVTRDPHGKITAFRPVAMMVPLYPDDYEQTCMAWLDVSNGYDYRSFFKIAAFRGMRLGNYIHPGAAGYMDWMDSGQYYNTDTVYMTVHATKRVSMVTIITGEYLIEQDMELGTALILRNGSSLVVKSGATLSLTGTIVNEGLIKIEEGAGLIICNGAGIQTVDPFHPASSGPARFTDYGRIINHGELAVLAGGYVITPGDGSAADEDRYSVRKECHTGIECYGAGNFVIAGNVLVGKNLHVEGSLQVAPQGVLIVGMMTDEPYEAKSFDNVKKQLTRGNNREKIGEQLTNYYNKFDFTPAASAGLYNAGTAEISGYSLFLGTVTGDGTTYYFNE